MGLFLIHILYDIECDKLVTMDWAPRWLKRYLTHLLKVVEIWSMYGGNFTILKHQMSNFWLKNIQAQSNFSKRFFQDYIKIRFFYRFSFIFSKIRQSFHSRCWYCVESFIKSMAATGFIQLQLSCRIHAW